MFQSMVMESRGDVDAAVARLTYDASDEVHMAIQACAVLKTARMWKLPTSRRAGPPTRKGARAESRRFSRTASTVAAFSVRARPGMAVSMPVSWDELKDVKSGDQWTMAQAVHRQRTLAADPWEGYWRKRQRITAAMRRASGMKR
ncbi:hypothetical protein [Caballeronia sp. S22]|uniref:non-homologous end-joining DNA ligase LigD n=1 Tax=Caballeronia sp. S22 TaxID=3137182 RepID=UPI00353121D6